MKLQSVIVGITLCAALAAVTGCNKEESTPTPVVPAAGGTTPADAAKAVDAAKAATTQAADQVLTQATNQAKAGGQNAQGLIDSAKAFVADKKYQEALGSLNQLAGIRLTPEQQKLVTDLKTQIQNALAKGAAADPASALGGVLGDKK